MSPSVPSRGVMGFLFSSYYHTQFIIMANFSFSNARPNALSSSAVSATAAAIAASKYQEFPVDQSRAPFRLKLSDVLPGTLSSTKMVFHTAGDLGGIKTPQDQQIVANKMEHQFHEVTKKEDKPLFFYQLGDVVYYYGAESQYLSQFFEPYDHYPAPILGIPGNHDGDVDPTNPAPSLEAFIKVFCDKSPRVLPIAGDSIRTTMVQPNPYWTLQSPLANIIGLYTNVPEKGEVRTDQREWFIRELRKANTERSRKALIVALHHPVFSVDKHHGSSSKMKALLDDAFEEAKVWPDLILSGHVHNYQRFTREYQDGTQIPYVVAGAGGYWHLHAVDSKVDPIYVPTNEYFAEDGVTFEEFCDDRHGFMRITIENNNGKRTLTGEYFTVPRLHESWSAPATLYDRFTVDLKKNKVHNK